MINYEALEPRLDALAQTFRHASPFPHIVLESFFLEEAADAICREFPKVNDAFRRHIHRNARKYALNDWDAFPSSIRSACEALNSGRFVRLLSNLSGITPMYADPQLVGGGIHLIMRGGFLNIHADFNEHPLLKKKRCLNVLVYLNKEWNTEYQGALELWDREMQHCVVKTQPEFNRCVIFETTPTSFHGHPAPLACPPTLTRNSLATYYYTDWTSETERRLITTDYQLRPSDYTQKIRRAARRIVGPRVAAWFDSR